MMKGLDGFLNFQRDGWRTQRAALALGERKERRRIGMKEGQHAQACQEFRACRSCRMACRRINNGLSPMKGLSPNAEPASQMEERIHLRKR
jgi:hypothetical protein